MGLVPTTRRCSTPASSTASPALPRNGEATNIPWAGNYWPIYEDNINYKWDGATQRVGLRRSTAARSACTGVEDAVSKYHGIDSRRDAHRVHRPTASATPSIGEACAKRAGQTNGRCIPTWWGICHAWSPAAILLPEPKHAGHATTASTFKVNDIKALLTLVARPHRRPSSSRCAATQTRQLDSEINFDKYGRPTGASASASDTNPGTFHVLLANYLGMQGESFV